MTKEEQTIRARIKFLRELIKKLKHATALTECLALENNRRELLRLYKRLSYGFRSDNNGIR